MDTIADMFTILRNGYAANKESVVVTHSKLKMEIARLLQKEDYIKEINRRGKKSKKNIEITLLYKDKNPAIKQIKRISKPSRRVYASFKEMFPLGGGRGIRIVSTPKGILTDKAARKEKVGGEVVGEVW
jgi:small subunit ribosomal protein S8